MNNVALSGTAMNSERPGAETVSGSKHSTANTQKTSLIGLNRPQIAARLAAIGVPEKQLRMRTNQLWGWMYGHGATQFDAMTNIAKPLRTLLDRHFTIARPDIISEQKS